LPIIDIHHYHHDGDAGGRATPFYRSSAARYAMMTLGAFVAYSLAAGPAFLRSGIPSVDLLRNAIPLPLLAGLFVVYVAMLAFRVRRLLLAAYCLGALLYLANVFASVWVGVQHKPVNPIGFAAVCLAVILHLLAYRAVYFDHDMSGGGR
jgi:hypothetical protein